MLFVQSRDKTSAFNYLKSLCGRSAGQITDKKTGFTGTLDKLCETIRHIIAGFSKQQEVNRCSMPKEEVKESQMRQVINSQAVTNHRRIVMQSGIS